MTTKTDKRSKEFYDEELMNAPKNYERYFVPVISKPVAEDLIRLAEIGPNENVLDVACGTGIVTRLAADKIGNNGSITGLDINPGMLEVARSATQNMPVEFIEASAESIPFPDESFDVVLCQLSLQFMENKPAALREMHRVLRSDGRFLMNVPGSIGELFAIFSDEMEHHISTEAAGFARQVFSLNDTNELSQLLTDANFRRVDINEDTKTLKLPAPKDFLWQYIHSTPLVKIVSQVPKEVRDILEHKVVERWQQFRTNSGMQYQQRVITAKARK